VVALGSISGPACDKDVSQLAPMCGWLVPLVLEWLAGATLSSFLFLHCVRMAGATCTAVDGRFSL